MIGIFKIRVGEDILTFTDTEDLPDSYDNLISFKPDERPSPHTEEDHEYHESFTRIFNEILKRETK
jgi:hypothetical protein